MSEQERLIAALKHSLRARGTTYAQLARALAVSEASIKRCFSRGSFTLGRLLEILGVLELDLYELARISRHAGQGPVQLGLEQEQALAQDERLLSVFWLLLNGWTFEELLASFAISRAQLTLACAQLERLKLIEWGPRDRVRLRVRKGFEWRPGGPVKKAYGQRVMHEFLRGRFASSPELLRFETREMSADSAAVLKRRLERLVAEFNELAEVDSALASGKRIGVAMLVACRPWEFSVVNALKQRKSGEVATVAAAQALRRHSKPR